MIRGTSVRFSAPIVTKKGDAAMRSSLAALAIVAAWSVTAHAAGDPSRGEVVFHQCMICHAVGVKAHVGLGPPLNGVVGRGWAMWPNFKYTGGLLAGQKAGKIWDDSTLDLWLTDPQKMVPGTKMYFGGLHNKQQRDDVIAYLRQFDPNGQKKQP
jgi:cytochrome c